jgi:hypothetical protein
VQCEAEWHKKSSCNPRTQLAEQNGVQRPTKSLTTTPEEQPFGGEEKHTTSNNQAHVVLLF